MKKTLLTLALTVVTASVFAQGTVNFSNGSSVWGSTRNVTFLDTPGVANGTALSTNAGGLNLYGLRAQLFYGAAAVENSLVAVTTAPASLRSSTSASSGTWFGGTRTLDGFSAPGTIVQLQVRIWDTTLAADWNAALLPGYTGLIGKSAIFAYTIPTSPTPAPADFNMVNFQAFTVSPVPEPTSFALAGMGLASLLIFRRRK